MRLSLSEQVEVAAHIAHETNRELGSLIHGEPLVPAWGDLPGSLRDERRNLVRAYLNNPQSRVEDVVRDYDALDGDVQAEHRLLHATTRAVSAAIKRL